MTFLDGVRARVGLKRLATGLLAYGAVGLVVAAIGAAGLLGAIGRIGDLTGRLDDDATGLIALVERASDALTDAGATARSFAVTVERTGPSVEQAASTIRQIEPRLRDLQNQANAVSILGTRPLGSLGDSFGAIATEMSGLDVRLDAIADELTLNKGALLANADSLTALGGELGTLGERLGEGSVGELLGDARFLLTLALALLVVWAAVPAVGALVLGLWLRRLLRDGTASIVT